MRLGKASGPLIRQMHLAKHEQCVLINDLANPGFGKVLSDMVEAIKLLIAAAPKSPTLLPGE